MNKILWMMGILVPALALASQVKNPALIDVQDGVYRPAPDSFDSYLSWAEPILHGTKGDYTSAFTENVFSWYAEEKDRGLPHESYVDKDGVYVNVERPLRETIELEESGEIEEGTTVGAEVYAVMEGSVDQALEAMLYRWGKPVGKTEGWTYPPGGVFSRRIEYFSPNADWGTGAFASLSLRRDGGIVKDLADRYLVLVRGDANHGYDILMQFIGEGGRTPTTKVFAMAMIRPLEKGKVSYKISTRFQGQSYKILGNVSIGRRNIGFNVEKVRAIQLEYMSQLKELRESGKISEKKSDIEYGK